ncbi:MAG: hypothetical protein IT290_02975, partial [Deltaproteobacteria bacterium]|nr:hypothetical protein [Deltaproteobacteria bacterium]
LGSARAKSAYTRSEAFTTELDQLIVSLQATDEQVREYERSVIPAVREAVTLYDRQVREGQGSVQQLWQTQRELADTSDRSIELVVKAVAARAELSALVGQDI